MRHKKIEWTGYFPGVVGKITELHAVYYHENWGFDASFETQVGREISEFIVRFNESRDRLRVARVGKAFAGCCAIDGHFAGTEGARLRWFMVAPSFQNQGIGQKLLQDAVDFCCRGGYRRIFLWTFKGLDRARVLYEKAGFVLCLEHTVRQWGQDITEQRYELILSF